MAWPGVISEPQYNAGLECPTPELREMYWLEGIAESQPDSRQISDGLDLTVRTDEAEHGYAVAAAVVDEDGAPGLQVEIVLEEVWDVVLVDSFEADLCVGFSPSDPFSERTPFFFGVKDEAAPRLLTKGHLDGDEYIPGFLKPNPVAPGGLSASCLFKNLYLAVTGHTGGWIKVTPVVNGEVLDDEAAAFAVPYDEDVSTLRRYEIPLTREYDPGGGVVSRAGVVGTWFTCEIEVIDAFGCGRLEIVGVEVEYVVLNYDNMGLSFTGETMSDPARSPSITFFVAGEGSSILRGGVGIQDDGADYGILLQTNEVAPAGVGGECLFEAIHIAVTRNNDAEWTVTITPIIDGVDQEPVEITYDASSDVVTEHEYVSLAQPYKVDGVEVSKYYPRGAWFALRIEADDIPSGDFTFEEPELGYEVLTESQKDVFNA